MSIEQIIEWGRRNLDSTNIITIGFFAFVGVGIFWGYTARRIRRRSMEQLARELHCRFTATKNQPTNDVDRKEFNIIEGQWRGMSVLIYDVSQYGAPESHRKIKLFGHEFTARPEHEKTTRQTYVNGKYYAGFFGGHLSPAKIKRLLTGDRTIKEVQNPLTAVMSNAPSLHTPAVLSSVWKVVKTILKVFAIFNIIALGVLGVIIWYLLNSYVHTKQ